jgi:hypothetical protein
MDEPPAKRMRLNHTAADVGSNLPFLDAGAPIGLDNLCQIWEEQPLDFKRPLVFFTVGHATVLSSASGTPETGSLCRQFWNWLGQPDPYRPDQIAFRMVDGRGIYMSLPNLTQFKVKFKHGPELESIVTLAPKKNDEPQTLSARTVMTSAYPATAFRTCPWWGCQDEELVNIEAVLKYPGEVDLPSPELYISGFYSKASDPEAALAIEEKSDEGVLLRGAGRRLLCLMLDTVQWTHAVTLHASGLSHRDKVSLEDRARGMQTDEIMEDLQGDIMKDLKDLNPNMFSQWTDKRRLNKIRIQNIRKRVPLTLEDKQQEAEDDLEMLRSEWVRIRGNQELVTYYMRTFGFKPLAAESFTYVKMGATPEMIRERCHANAKKDGDCVEVIVSQDVVRAASQVANLQHCKHIRTLYLYDVKALPIVESLLPVTKCLGLLGLTSLFNLEAIDELLTSREQLAVQIDCLCLDRSDWSWVTETAEHEAWQRLYVRSVLVLSFDGMDEIYDDVMNALKAKTGAVYHKVSGFLPYYMETKRVDRAVQVKGEVMTDIGRRLYDAAGTKIESDGF